jgi:hypothetical protein
MTRAKGKRQGLQHRMGHRPAPAPSEAGYAWAINKAHDRMPTGEPHGTPVVWHPPLKGPRYSPDPTNPLGMKGHMTPWVPEAHLLQLEALGYVIIDLRDPNVVAALGSIVTAAFHQQPNPSIKARLSAIAVSCK